MRALGWELVQNLPLIAGFVLGLDLWQRGEVALAVVCMVAGSVLGALAIWATEAGIVAGHREPPGVVLTNLVVMAGLMMGVAAYLSAPWSRWWMDVVFGVLGGILLGVAQDRAAGAPIGVGHCVAMALALPLVLVGLRVLSARLPVLASVCILAVLVTVVIAWIDYGPPRFDGQERQGKSLIEAGQSHLDATKSNPVILRSASDEESR
jgi:hypothetical protein